MIAHRFRAAVAACALAASAGGPAGAATGPRAVLPFLRDDYAKAIAEARARKVPLFIESWAPW